MKSYLLLAVTFTVAQALSNTPLSNFRNFNPAQGQLSYSSPNVGIAGRRDVSESYQQETGNLYGGQRDGRFVTRDSGDNYRGVQYSVRPGRDFSSVNEQGPNPYQQQGIRRFQDGGQRGDTYGYSGRNPQISFTGPLANTRSYNPRFDATGNQQNEYRYY